MIQRIRELHTMPGLRLDAVFDDGRHVVYDLHDDLQLPDYSQLADVPGLFESVRLDESRTCVYWNDRVDLPSDIIYEYGQVVNAS